MKDNELFDEELGVEVKRMTVDEAIEEITSIFSEWDKAYFNRVGKHKDATPLVKTIKTEHVKE